MYIISVYNNVVNGGVFKMVKDKIMLFIDGKIVW